MTFSEEDDRALVARVVERRDERAFRALYRRHTNALYATARRVAADPVDAAEAVHDAWIRAVEGLRSFEWRGTLRARLAGILLNVVRERRRARRDDQSLDEEHLADRMPARDVLLAIDLDTAIRRLSSGYREVFVLHDIDGFTHEEIARMLGVDAGTSKSQLARARRRLRELLGEPRDPLPSLDHSDGT